MNLHTAPGGHRTDSVRSRRGHARQRRNSCSRQTLQQNQSVLIARVASQPVRGVAEAPSKPSTTSHGVATTPLSTTLLCSPDELVLEPGVLSSVERDTPLSAADAFRCPGCSEAACQTRAGCAATTWRFNTDGYLREILTARVYDVAIQSPLEEARKLSEQLDNTILLKREDLQPVFSFKLRGAYNKMAKLSKEQLKLGVITSSAGNHAQGVALAASKLGCTAIICMPVTTPEIKVNAVKRLGGMVELVGESYQEAQAYALQRALHDGLTFIAPYDDPYTIAGQGTIGDEILRQVSDPDTIDAIFVPVGGGGLIAGIAAYVKALKPHISIIGVEPSGANAMAISLQRGERSTLSKVDAFADGVAVKQVGAETFRMCRELVDGVVLVDNAAISAAIKDVFNETRSILEPAGALSVAGAKAWLQHNGHKGKKLVAITSGANMNFERLRLVSELADLGAMAEAMLATTIPERPGAFREFVDTATSSTGKSLYITEFKYRYSAGANAHVLWSMAFRGAQQLSQVVKNLSSAGMETVDVSRMPAAQMHLRHLVGGRARSYMGEIPHEKIFQITFPERKGALKRFLDALCPIWNVTLFHYRNSGNRESYVLLGLQVPPYEEQLFKEAVQGLRDEFVFSELAGEDRRIFNMFIQ